MRTGIFHSPQAAHRIDPGCIAGRCPENRYQTEIDVGLCLTAFRERDKVNKVSYQAEDSRCPAGVTEHHLPRMWILLSMHYELPVSSRGTEVFLRFGSKIYKEVR